MTDRPRVPIAKDLSTEEPRPMDASVAGYPWLPRMIDKARAARAGTLGTYYRFPCPIDAVCLRRLGVAAEDFVDIASTCPSDQLVVERLAASGARPPHVAAFDPIKLNARLHGDGAGS